MTDYKSKIETASSILAGEDRRRSQRVIIRVPVTLEVTMSGEKVTAAGNTVAVNVHGAMLACVRPFDSGTLLTVINSRTNERATARVTRTPRESAEGYLIPIEFDRPSPSFWQISFPAPNWKPSEG